jgi:hypothetical protein
MSKTYAVRKYYPDGSSEPVREEIVLHDFNRPASPNTPSNGKDGLGITTTDDLPEGKKNLYYNQERITSLVLSLLNRQPDGNSNSPVKDLLDGKASVEDLNALQVAVAKMQQAVSSVLSKANGSSADFNDALLELKKELSSKVSSSEFVKLLATRVTIQDLEDTIKPYATTSRVNLLSDKVNKQELRLKALESTEDAHSTASILELINKKVSKDELKESLATYSALLGNIQNGLSGYATTSYVRSEIERTRLDPTRFATPADVEAVSKAFDAKLKDASKAITSALSVDTGSLVTHESFNLRMNQEVSKLNEKLGDLATKKQLEAITPLLVLATPTQQGLMSSFDKEKLDSLPVPRSIAMKDDLIAVSKRVSSLESSGLDTSKFVTRADLDLLAEDLRVANKKTDLSPYALSSDVNGKYAKLTERVSVLEAKADKPIDLSSLVTVQTFNALANKVNSISIPTLPDFKSFAQAVKVEELDTSLTSFKREVETNYLGKQAFRTEFENLQDILSQQVKGLSSRIDRLSTFIRMLPSGDIKVDGAAVTDEQLEGKLSSIRTELKSLTKELETKYASFQQVNGSVYRRLDAATAAIVALEQRVGEISLVNAEQNGKIDLLKASIAKLPDTNLVSEIARRVSSVETKVESIKVPSIEALETQVGVHSAELVTVRNQVREIQTVLPTEAKPNNTTLVSHGAMKKYVSDSLAETLTPTATRTSEGLVRLATQAEVHSRTGTSVPTVADVSTMLTNLTVASKLANGLMTPSMLYSLEQAATKRELSDESSKLNDTFTNSLTQQNKRIDSIGREQSNLRVRVSTLEGASGIDPTVFATKTEYNSLKAEVERVSKFDRITHDDLEDAKTLLTKGYESKVKELDTKLSAEITKVSEALSKKPDGKQPESASVDTSNLVTKRELAIATAELRSEFPKVAVDRFVTADVFHDTVKTKVDPLVSTVALLKDELARKVSITEFNDYKQSVIGLGTGGAVNLTSYAKKDDLDETKKQVASIVKVFGTIEDVKSIAKMVDVTTNTAAALTEAKKFTTDSISPLSERVSEVETRLTTLPATSSSVDLTPYAKTTAVDAVNAALDAFKVETAKGIKEAKDALTPVSNKVNSTASTLSTFMESVPTGYIPASDKPTFATKEELKEYVQPSALATLASKEELSAYATKEELNGYATKEELAKIPAPANTDALATKEELKGYATVSALSDLATKEQVEALPKPVVIKAELTDGTAKTLDLSAYAGKVVRLTAVLANTAESAVTLTKATLTLGDLEIVAENKEIASNKHLILEPRVLVPYADSTYSVVVAGANASITAVVEVLA